MLFGTFDAKKVCHNRKILLTLFIIVTCKPGVDYSEGLFRWIVNLDRCLQRNTQQIRYFN